MYVMWLQHQCTYLAVASNNFRIMMNKIINVSCDFLIWYIPKFSNVLKKKKFKNKTKKSQQIIEWKIRLKVDAWFINSTVHNKSKFKDLYQKPNQNLKIRVWKPIYPSSLSSLTSTKFCIEKNIYTRIIGQLQSFPFVFKKDNI